MTQEPERAGGGHTLLMLPWRIVCFAGRIVRRLFVVIGVLAALAVVGYVEFEAIVEAIDSRYGERIDAYLGIDRAAIARLHDPAYFAQQSVMVTEDQKTVACISSPEHRILINDVADIPPLFVSAILASEDKNFFTHEGIDKGAIVRALGKRILQESRSGRLDADDADRQAPSRRHRPRFDRDGKGRRHRHGAAHRARILARAAAGQVRQHAVLRPRAIRHRSGQPRVFRQAREGAGAAPGGVHRCADQQAGAARPIVRDGPAAQGRATKSATRTGPKRRAAPCACST